MKKVILALMLIMGTAVANAQFFVGGTLGIATEKTSDQSRQTTFGLAPDFGYNFNSHWAVGLNLMYQYGEYGSVSVNSVNVGPFVRWTFAKAGKFGFFGELDTYYMYSKPNNGDSVEGFGLFLDPGATFHINNHWSILAKTNLFKWVHRASGLDDNTVGFAINPLNIELGFDYEF